MLRSLACVALCPLCAAWSAVHAPLPQMQRTSQLRMVSANPATVAKKQAIIDEVKETMEGSTLMFCVRSEGITVNDMNMMRQKFDDSVTIRCVKNTLVKRATDEVPKFQGGDSLLEYSNYWFFVPEEQMRPTVETWNEFVEGTKKVRRARTTPPPKRVARARTRLLTQATLCVAAATAVAQLVGTLSLSGGERDCWRHLRGRAARQGWSHRDHEAAY
jgi:ribosomal protein L10